jgi:hypothetical protein
LWRWQRSPWPLLHNCRIEDLSAATGKRGELIKVSSEIQQLQKLSAATTPVDRWQILWLHQHITEQVMAASLQVDAPRPRSTTRLHGPTRYADISPVAATML